MYGEKAGLETAGIPSITPCDLFFNSVLEFHVRSQSSSKRALFDQTAYLLV